MALSVAALTVAALGVLSGGTPAAADTTAPVITLQHPATVAVPTAVATGVATTAQAYLVYTTDSGVLTGATITVDARKLARIADVSFPDECTVSNAIATCSEFFSAGGPGELIAGPQFTMTAHAGVAPGTTASYKITGMADSATFVGATGSVQIGGPAFNQVQPPEHTGLAVGSTVSEPVEFTNTGDRPAAAAQALLIASPGLTFAQHYANCRYSSVPDDREAEKALCTFDQPILIGERAALATPVDLNVTATALYTYLDTITAPKGDPLLKSELAGRTWTRGTGTTLKLQVLDPGQPSTAPVGKVSLPFADPNSDDRMTALQADNTADFSVSGATAQAAQGDTVPLDVSMTNNGPATLFDRSISDFGVMVTLPPGTTVVGSSANCHPETDDDPQAAAHGPYDCVDSYLEPAGHTAAFTVTVRVDQVIAGAQGSVAVLWGVDGGGRPTYDPDVADDSAVLALN
ncbi:hypothetical protein OG900_38585 [Streptomyces sp. NBC_00433]